ncbi:MAG: RHS repeat-associated core domain-containing protein, partial [Lentisphaerales bacterium]
VWGSGIDNLLAMTVYTGATVKSYFALTDHLRSVHALVDETGAIVEQYKLDAWGRTTVYDGNGVPLTKSAIGNRYAWQGREISWVTGLYYFRFRTWDPISGRFLSNDPIGISGGLNQYILAGNCVTMFRDPFGLYMGAPGAETWHPMAKEEWVGGWDEPSPLPLSQWG